MSTFAIGDLQGCHDELRHLLDRLAFDPSRDRLWLVGDLVNRGPKSLETLRFLQSLGDAAVCLLGNHDLHLLACAAGAAGSKGKDTFEDVLQAPDREPLLQWLRTRPLLHHDARLGYTMVHAGLAPQWTIAQAAALAREAEQVIAGEASDAFFRQMYGDEPDRWEPGLEGHARIRFVVNCLTRLRVCHADGRLALRDKGKPDFERTDLLPWFALPHRASAKDRIVFGHWSTLGRVDWPEYRVHGLDSGCVWGGALSALTLETGDIVQCPCRGHQQPGAD